MKEYKRKLQLIAGSTYSLSLPKEWVKKLNISPKQELMMAEQQDGNLLISPKDLKMLDEKIILPLDEYLEDFSQIIVSLYYYGYNLIDFVSMKEISNDVRNKIRKVLMNLSGAEIIFEDKKTIRIKILFDEDRINIYQLLYRISLIIGCSIDNLVEKFNFEEINSNENEVDQLYHFSIKIIQSSLTDRSILISSKINNLKVIPSLFLISKKLETIADSFKKIAKDVELDKVDLGKVFPVLIFIKEEINKGILYLMGKQKKKFCKFSDEEKTKIIELMDKLKQDSTKIYMRRIIRDLSDIQDEVISIGFYNKMLEKEIK